MSEEGVQPVEGQGDESPQGNDLYGQFLEGISPEMHDSVIPALKAQDASFTKRFQALSEKSKPYEELGVFDTDPETVGSYLGLANALEAAQGGDEDAIEAVQEWYDQVGDALGFTKVEEEGDSDSVSEDGEFDPFDQSQISKLLEEQIQKQVGPLADFVQQQQESQQQSEALREAEEQIEAQITELKEANPDLSDDVVEEVLELAEAFIEEDNPVAAGYEKYKAILSRGESNLFEKKSEQPGALEGAGQANTAPPEVNSSNVAQIARERLEREKQLLG